MNKDSKDLSIRGESIQSLYGSYLAKAFLVNRRYQRKLVWTIEEKRSFIDSIIKGYPVPLILLAEVIKEDGIKLEIIDGMQRMNAIMSFIEQEFDIDEHYFDLDTMADTKLLKDQAHISQKNDVLDRVICANIVRYNIPLSVFKESRSSDTDEVFKRLNFGGRQLSKQELRQAGTTSKFASIVRKLASNIRGDSSPQDELSLNSMKNISITNKKLDYGIPVEKIFWVKNDILTKKDLRESKDEEVIADIVAWISLKDGCINSSSDILDQLYGYDDSESKLAGQVEIQIRKVNEEVIINNIQYVFDELIKIIEDSDRNFNSLLFNFKHQKIARYFQVVFLAFYKLLIDEQMEVVNRKGIVSHLDKAGDTTMKLPAGGSIWTAKDKKTKINSLYGVLMDCFEKSTQHDPSRNTWITRFENLLMQSSAEQTLYDFKIGLHALSENESNLNEETFSKVIKTLTAMANTLPNATGYCIIGVADKKSDADRFKQIYNSNYISYSSFFITGINSEAKTYYGDVDKYFTKITQLIKSQPLNDRDIDYLSRNITSIKYFDKEIVILKLESGNKPSLYGSKYYSDPK